MPPHLAGAREQIGVVGDAALEAADRLALRQDVQQRALARAGGTCGVGWGGMGYMGWEGRLSECLDRSDSDNEISSSLGWIQARTSKRNWGLAVQVLPLISLSVANASNAYQ